MQNKSINEALEEVFNISPLPNNLKAPKKRFKSGKMLYTAKINIVNEHSNYTVDFDNIMCKPKQNLLTIKPLEDTEG